MRLLEDDYLGGYGSRGAGKIAFENLKVELRPLKYYLGEGGPIVLADQLDLRDQQGIKTLIDKVKQHLQGG